MGGFAVMKAIVIYLAKQDRSGERTSASSGRFTTLCLLTARPEHEQGTSKTARQGWKQKTPSKRKTAHEMKRVAVQNETKAGQKSFINSKTRKKE